MTDLLIFSAVGLLTWFFYFKARQAYGQEFSNYFMADYFGEGSFLSLVMAKVMGIFWTILFFIGFYSLFIIMGSGNTDNVKSKQQEPESELSKENCPKGEVWIWNKDGSRGWCEILERG